MSTPSTEDFDCRVREKREREILEEERVHARVLQDVKDMDEMEGDFLSRTVLVMDIKGMKNKSNRRKLKIFLEKKFGKVGFCEITSLHEEENVLHSPENPPVRVQFKKKKDAEKIFGGKRLLGLIDRRTFVHELGAFKQRNGSSTFCVRPSYRYPGMLDGALTRKIVTMKATKMSLGHWMPYEKDAYIKVFMNYSSIPHENLWIQEYAAHEKPQFTIDVRNLNVELKVPRNHDDNGEFTFANRSDFVTFPFKSILHKMELCRVKQTGEYAIAISLKHPPRLDTQKNPISGQGYMFYDARLAF